MTCHRCGNDNRTDALFCANCGTPLLVEPVSSTVSLSQPETGQLETASLPYRDLRGLIDETFSVYQRNFLPFFLIALVPQVPLLVAAGTAGAVALLFYLLGVILSILASGATIHAVIQQQLGRRIYVGEGYRRAWQSAVPLIIAGIIVALALMAAAILIFIMVGIPLLIYILVVWYFYMPPIILEGKSPTAALGRSRELVRENWWRVFGIVAVFTLISIGLAVVSLIPTSILTSLMPILEDIFKAGAQALIFPVNAIGATLVYLDLRTRKEGYTLGEMASEMDR